MSVRAALQVLTALPRHPDTALGALRVLRAALAGSSAAVLAEHSDVLAKLLDTLTYFRRHAPTLEEAAHVIHDALGSGEGRARFARTSRHASTLTSRAMGGPAGAIGREGVAPEEYKRAAQTLQDVLSMHSTVGGVMEAVSLAFDVLLDSDDAGE